MNSNYNTQRSHLFMPEHGRHIQQMVEYCMGVAERDERNKIANAIVQVMANLSPQQKDLEDHRQKLWDHLFIISDFQLDVDSPYPKPTREAYTSKPEKMAYPRKDIKYGHYGKTIELMIKKACEYAEGEERQALVMMIANLMKRMYLTWNRDSVTDEVIFDHLREMSLGKIILKDVQLSNANMGKPAFQHKKKKHNGKKHFKKRF
ncbi:MAG: DUF4290 domain-containing protein [Flavobacteriales bacterium]